MSRFPGLIALTGDRVPTPQPSGRIPDIASATAPLSRAVENAGNAIANAGIQIMAAKRNGDVLHGRNEINRQISDLTQAVLDNQTDPQAMVTARDEGYKNLRSEIEKKYAYSPQVQSLLLAHLDDASLQSAQITQRHIAEIIRQSEIAGLRDTASSIERLGATGGTPEEMRTLADEAIQAARSSGVLSPLEKQSEIRHIRDTTVREVTYGALRATDAVTDDAMKSFADSPFADDPDAARSSALLQLHQAFDDAVRSGAMRPEIAKAKFQEASIRALNTFLSGPNATGFKLQVLQEAPAWTTVIPPDILAQAKGNLGKIVESRAAGEVSYQEAQLAERQRLNYVQQRFGLKAIPVSQFDQDQQNMAAANIQIQLQKGDLSAEQALNLGSDVLSKTQGYNEFTDTNKILGYEKEDPFSEPPITPQQALNNWTSGKYGEESGIRVYNAAQRAWGIHRKYVDAADTYDRSVATGTPAPNTEVMRQVANRNFALAMRQPGDPQENMRKALGDAARAGIVPGSILEGSNVLLTNDAQVGEFDMAARAVAMVASASEKFAVDAFGPDKVTIAKAYMSALEGHSGDPASMQTAQKSAMGAVYGKKGIEINSKIIEGLMDTIGVNAFSKYLWENYRLDAVYDPDSGSWKPAPGHFYNPFSWFGPSELSIADAAMVSTAYAKFKQTAVTLAGSPEYSGMMPEAFIKKVLPQAMDGFGRSQVYSSGATVFPVEQSGAYKDPAKIELDLAQSLVPGLNPKGDYVFPVPYKKNDALIQVSGSLVDVLSRPTIGSDIAGSANINKAIVNRETWGTGLRASGLANDESPVTRYGPALFRAAYSRFGKDRAEEWFKAVQTMRTMRLRLIPDAAINPADPRRLNESPVYNIYYLGEDEKYHQLLVNDPESKSLIPARYSNDGANEVISAARKEFFDALTNLGSGK